MNVTFEGKQYTLVTDADFTGIELDGRYVNYNDASDGEEYHFEMSAEAQDDKENKYLVFWIFSDIKGEDGQQDLSNFDFYNVDRVELVK
ncbi:MAG: hypothetical protein ACQEXV_22540 [Bacillota bacterium]